MLPLADAYSVPDGTLLTGTWLWSASHSSRKSLTSYRAEDTGPDEAPKAPRSAGEHEAPKAPRSAGEHEPALNAEDDAAPDDDESLPGSEPAATARVPQRRSRVRPASKVRSFWG
jgi:hypothetical protein